MLEPTMRSVRSQTYPNIEHIVVDGGSTDDTLALLNSYAGTYRLRWISERDKGMYPAINKGLSMANGEIQAYLNSDDLYFPWALEVVVDAFVRHPDVDVVYGDVMEIDDPTGKTRLAWNLPFDLGYLRRSGFMWQPGAFWRSRLFESAAGFDETIQYGADLDFWLRLGAQGRRFMKINEFVAIARQHPETLSLVHRPRVVDELAQLRMKHAPQPRPARPWAQALDHIRRPLWSRIYWMGLILQSLVPTRLRRGPWSRFLGVGQTKIAYVAVVLRPIPGLGRRAAGPMLRPSRNWLEPPR